MDRDAKLDIHFQHPCFKLKLLLDLLETCFEVQPEPINVAQFICVGEPLVAEIVAGLGKISTIRGHRFLVDTERLINRFHRFALTFPQREAATRFLNIAEVFPGSLRVYQ